MAIPEGANPSELDDLARQFDELAGEIERRRFWLTGWIDGDRFWRGARADEFRHSWSNEFSPQLSNAVDFLRANVRVLHDNANQQRVASGEQPKDYGSGSFLDKLFGGAVHEVESVVHTAEDGIEAVAGAAVGAVETGLQQGWKDLKIIGGSKQLAEVLGAVQIVGTVAAFCPPPIDGVAAVAGVVVMAGHLAQMANRGRFDPVEFTEDCAGVVGGAGVAGFKALSSAEKLKTVVGAAGDVNILRKASDVGLYAFANSAGRRAAMEAVVGVRVLGAGAEVDDTAQTVYSDVRSHHYDDAVTDAAAGFGGAAADLAGKHSADISHLLSGVKESQRIGTRGVEDGLAELGGYEQ